MPEGTKELLLICDDPDAPTAEPWVHWVIYKIPADAKGLKEGIPQKPRLADPAGHCREKILLAGQNIGYRGPMPPRGPTHRYNFKLYALEAKMSGGGHGQEGDSARDRTPRDGQRPIDGHVPEVICARPQDTSRSGTRKTPGCSGPNAGPSLSGRVRFTLAA